MAKNLRAGLRQSIKASRKASLSGGNVFGSSPLDLRFALQKTLDPRVTFTRASTGTFMGSNGLIATAATDAPRFDHNPTTGESLGLLVEEARANLLLRSEELDNNTAWQRNGATLPTVTANAGVAPNGTTTADLWTRSIATSNFISQATTKAASTIQYTYSIFVKQAVGNFCALRCQGIYPNKVDVVFNISSGAIHTPATVAGGTFTGPSAFITAYPNGWYRLTVTATSDTATFHECLTSFSSNGVVIDGSDSVSNSAGFLWGAQLEAGASPTSYIPTTTATVTRAADVASITGSNFSSWYNQTEGTVFAEVAVAQPNTGGNQFVFRTSDNTYNNTVAINIPGQAQLSTASSGTFDGSANSVANLVANVSAKISAAYATNNLGISLNGATAITDTSATMPTGLNRADIGSDHAGFNRVKAGTIKRLTYWPVRLADPTLVSITQP